MASTISSRFPFSSCSLRVFLARAGAVACLFIIAISASADAKPKPAAPPPPLFPTAFSAWDQAPAPIRSSNVNVADSGNAAVLKECGFQRFVSANYMRDDGKLAIRAMQFGDASGAYSAFTFYRRPGMLVEDIGTGAAYDGTHILFWQGDLVVAATFNHLSAMSASELRGLAQQLPQPAGSAGIRPSITSYLPPQHLARNSIRYALGPQTYALGGGVLPSSLVDFNRGAEVVTAQYNVIDGTGTMTLIEYPTPQIAIDRTAAAQNYLKAGNSTQNSWTQALGSSNQAALQVRRSGVLVAVTSGDFSAAEVQSVLGNLHYEANVTWNNPKGYISDASKMGRLVVGIFALVGILGGASIFIGFFFGGGRALVRRMRGKPASAFDESTEFISLNLKD